MIAAFYQSERARYIAEAAEFRMRVKQRDDEIRAQQEAPVFSKSTERMLGKKHASHTPTYHILCQGECSRSGYT
jgi:hypothetical protein